MSEVKTEHTRTADFEAGPRGWNPGLRPSGDAWLPRRKEVTMQAQGVSNSLEPRLSIGAVARATGFSPDTLRVWQKRYGFPVPQRKPSGHRLYSSADVRRLRRISQAIARGHRPGQVVALAEPRLESLLTDAAAPARAEPNPASSLRSLMNLVRKHAGPELTVALLADAASLGPIEFLRQRAVPLINEVGEAWSRGELGIHHEHSFSQRLEDVLRALRMPYDRAASGPRIALAAFAGETHGLGLQMAALIAAVSGLQPHVLGTDTPVAEIVAAFKAHRAAAIGISISVSTAGVASRDRLLQLRSAIPAAVPILVGGQGARRSHPPGGCVIVDDLAGMYDWMRRASVARAS
jgi:DNA-binding transcriptional MerR regulator/methylmalonyl-CoA mutase cobalamin-binding subunit